MQDLYLLKLYYSMRTFIFLLLLGITHSATGQHGRFHSGLIVTNTGDTLNGAISWKKNPESKDSLYLKKSEQSHVQAYAWSSLRYFGTPGEDDHITATVKRNLEYIDPYTFNIMLKDSIRTEVIPLTAVYSGKHLSLYKYYGPSDYFFISNGTKVIQLVQTYRYLTTVEQRFYIQRVPRFFINYIYRNQLLEFYDFDADQKMFNLLEATDYKEYQLKTLVVKMDKKIK